MARKDYASSDRVLSFTSLSVPHLDPFSKTLFGPTAPNWHWQQVASQYFTAFVLENSASLFNNFWFEAMRCYNDICFDAPADLQKALWWYNGIFNNGTDAKVAMPPSMTVDEINATDYPGKASPIAIRSVFSEYTGNGYGGYPQTEYVGNISAPTLFVCGSEDEALLCTMPEMDGTTYCPEGYTYKEVVCGHRLTQCADDAVTADVLESIVSHIGANTLRVKEVNV